MDLARIVLHGSTWPDGQPTQHDAAGARVVYVDAEGIHRSTARATAMAVDTKRMYLLTADVGELLDLTRQVWRDRLPRSRYTVSPALVIIDSLNAVTSTGTKSVEDVNALMSFRPAGVARYFDTSLVLVHHLRKPGGGQLMLPGISSDFMGSAHITAMMRSVIGMSVVQQKAPVQLERAAAGGGRQDEFDANLPASAFRHAGTAGARRGALQLCACRSRRYRRRRTDAGRVAGEISGRERSDSLGDLVDDAEQENISKTALHRACKRLGGRIVDSGKRKSRGNQWMLVESGNPPRQRRR